MNINCEGKIPNADNSKYFKKAILLILSTVLLIGFVPINNALSQTINCDESLEVIKNDWLAYQKRGERCEGRYEKKLSNTGIISLLGYQNINLDITQSDSFYVRTKFKITELIELQVNSHPYDKIGYRLDYENYTNKWARFSNFIIKNLQLELNKLNFLAILNQKKDEEIFVPTYVSNSKRTNLNEELVILFTRPIESLSFSFYDLDSGTKIKTINFENYISSGSTRKFQVKKLLPNDSGLIFIKIIGAHQNSNYHATFSIFVPS